MTDQCRTPDESFPFLPTGWQAEHIRDQFIPCHVGTARLLETVNNWTRSAGRAVRRPYSDSEESDNDVLYAEEHDSTVQQVSLRNNWLTQTEDDSCAEGVHS